MTRFRHEAATFQQEGDETSGASAGELIYLLQLTALCSDVCIEMNKGAPQLWGTLTEIALVRAALDAGIDVIALRQQHPLLRVQLRSAQRNYTLIAS